MKTFPPALVDLVLCRALCQLCDREVVAATADVMANPKLRAWGSDLEPVNKSTTDLGHLKLPTRRDLSVLVVRNSGHQDCRPTPTTNERRQAHE